MNLQTMIVLVIVIALVGLALRSIIRSRKRGGGCCGCSGGCCGCSGCSKAQPAEEPEK
ncbi:MAG: FeoB-associated Cys-rich membrane protein [Emergencia sp.]|nr:FeoB-associated Cys-rich membrane protein [Emergencia sp.]